MTAKWKNRPDASEKLTPLNISKHTLEGGERNYQISKGHEEKKSPMRKRAERDGEM